MSATHEEYHRIQANIKKAKEEGNKRKLSIWKGKLESWQKEYGAYAPVSKILAAHQYD